MRKLVSLSLLLATMLPLALAWYYSSRSRLSNPQLYRGMSAAEWEREAESWYFSDRSGTWQRHPPGYIDWRERLGLPLAPEHENAMPLLRRDTRALPVLQ